MNDGKKNKLNTIKRLLNANDHKKTSHTYKPHLKLVNIKNSVPQNSKICVVDNMK